MQNEYTKNKKLIKNKIMIHRICISNILAWDKNIPCKKNLKKKMDDISHHLSYLMFG